MKLTRAAALFSVMFASGCATEPTPPQQAPGTATSRCESVILYEICGDARAYSGQFAAIQGAFDLEQGEELEIESQLQRLTGAASGSQATNARSRRQVDLEPQWNAMVEPYFKRLRLYGGIAIFALDQGRLTAYALQFPELSVVPTHDLSLLYRPSFRFSPYSRLLFAQGSLGRVDLRKDFPVILDLAVLGRICDAMLDTPATLRPGDCQREVARGFAGPLLVPNMELSNENKARFNLMDAAKRYYTWTWIHAIYLSELKRYAAERPRRVFAFRADRGSPNVDRFGNLYLPTNLLDNGATRLAPEDLKLVMLHEAGHVGLFAHDMSKAIGALWMGEIMQIMSGAEYDARVERFMQVLARAYRRPNESLADLLALSAMHGDASARGKFRALVARLETVSQTRTDTLDIYREHLDAGGDTTRLLLTWLVVANSEFLADPKAARSRLSKYDSARDWDAAVRLYEIAKRDLARSGIDMFHDASEGLREPISILDNPWSIERQMIEFYRSAGEKLRAQLYN